MRGLAVATLLTRVFISALYVACFESKGPDLPQIVPFDWEGRNFPPVDRAFLAGAGRVN